MLKLMMSASHGEPVFMYSTKLASVFICYLVCPILKISSTRILSVSSLVNSMLRVNARLRVIRNRNMMVESANSRAALVIKLRILELLIAKLILLLLCLWWDYRGTLCS